MITASRELRYGTPVWADGLLPHIPSMALNGDVRTDVIVIGTGLSGAFLADELSDAGFAVALFDRRSPGSGSVLASTALIQYELDVPLLRLSAMIGADSAIRAWRRSRLGIDSLAARIRSLGIRCNLRPRRSLYLSGSAQSPEDLAQEQRARNGIGLQTALLSRETIKSRFGVQAQAALEAFGNYDASPYALARGFLMRARARGALIYAPEDIDHIETSPRRVYARTASGFCITARFLIFAAGYEVPKQLKDQDFRITSTWVLATPKQKTPQASHAPLIWEASDPYLYVRSTRDGRLICGGEDEPFADEARRDALIPQKIAALQRKLRTRLPEADITADYAWTGSFGVTPTGLPLIGPVPGLKNCYAILAFGGNGITHSRIAAELIRNNLTGIEDPDADLYQFRN